MRPAVLVLLATPLLGSCGFVTVTFPAVTNLTGARVAIGDKGIVVEHYNAVFRNAVTLPAVARVVAYGHEVARLRPGGVAVNNRLFQWQREVVPVVALFYEDAGNGKLGKFIGLAWGKIYLYPGRPVSQPLTFRVSNIMRPDGSYFYGYYNSRSLDHPAPIADLKEKVVYLPRKWWGGTNGLQMVNGSLFTARVRVNGNRVVAMLPPEGGFAYLEEIAIYNWRQVTSIQVDYLQQVGEQYLLVQSSLDIPFELNPHGVTGRQLIIGPPTRGARLY